jgi:predicted AAA+ superfamily ATPase
VALGKVRIDCKVSLTEGHLVELLRHRGEEPERDAARWTAAERSLVEKRFHEYLLAGGFPEAQGLSPSLRIELLQGYVDTVLFRDVVERYGVSQVAALRRLVRQCLRNPAGSVPCRWRPNRNDGATRTRANSTRRIRA